MRLRDTGSAAATGGGRIRDDTTPGKPAGRPPRPDRRDRYSHGGWTVLAIMDQDVAAKAKVAAHARHGFAAAIAFYPDCVSGPWVPAYRPAAPLLILAGEIDDWTPSAPCQRLADQTQRRGQPVSIKIYPGAHHSFDTYGPTRRVPEARQGRGATVGAILQRGTTVSSGWRRSSASISRVSLRLPRQSDAALSNWTAVHRLDPLATSLADCQCGSSPPAARLLRPPRA
jgi:hypothetical protein